MLSAASNQEDALNALMASLDMPGEIILPNEDDQAKPAGSAMENAAQELIAELTAVDVADKQAETIKAIQEAGVKVQTRITFILEYMAGKSAKLNGVIELAFKLLKSDSTITTAGQVGALRSG